MTDSTNTQSNANVLLARLRGLPGQIRAYGPVAVASFRNYLIDLTEIPAVRFRTVLWAICIIIVGFFTLVGTNPFRLLIPGAFFHLPASDARDSVILYGISAETQRPVKIKRRLAQSDAPEDRVAHIAFAVSRPAGLLESLGGADYADLEPLPDLGLAIRRVWFPGGPAHVLIDLRSTSLDEEVDHFLLSRTDGARPQTILLDGFFRAFTASVFEQMPEVQTIDYLVDGTRRNLPGMEFNLEQQYTRAQNKSGDTGG